MCMYVILTSLYRTTASPKHLYYLTGAGLLITSYFSQSYTRQPQRFSAV